MPTLSVSTPAGQILITTSDYAAGFGNLYSFYAASSTASGSNQLGEAGLAEWFHGAAGFHATTATTATAVQAGAGWDAGNGNGGVLCYDVEQIIPCTGSGSAFAVADPANQVQQIAHLLGSTSSTIVEKFWTIWANGTHAVASRNHGSTGSGGFGLQSNIRSSYITTTFAPSGTTTKWGFSGTHLGFMASCVFPVAVHSPGSIAGSDGFGLETVFTLNNATVAANAVSKTRLAVDGYENAVTSTLITNFDNDFKLHSGTNLTLTVATGTKTTSGTDLFGTASTAWTDGYDPERGAWVIAASANHVNLGSATATDWGINGSTVVKRHRPCFVITGWTDTGTPSVSLGGGAQTSGTDYQAYVDTGNQVLYLCLLKDVAGTEGALDVSASVGASDPFPLVYAAIPNQLANAAYRM